MPKAAKGNTGGAGNAAPAKKAGGGKKTKLRDMPEKIAKGTILTDLMGKQWVIGESIGVGGFGEIYTACKHGTENYDYVVKCEPHSNGPLFVEMHFYMRHLKLEDLQQFQKEKKLKFLGLPHMLGKGSVELNSIKHRFIVIPRFGSDVNKHYLGNGKILPEATVYRLAIQMLDVFEYMHKIGYVHGDLKAANILLGRGNNDKDQAYLVDFGLVCQYTHKEFKPDPKKMHNGTIEYTSRDAHLGVSTMRSDLEILGYNLINWLGVELPWETQKLLNSPVKVQKAKEAFMADFEKNLKNLFPKGVPAALNEFIKYVVNLKYDETPDYDLCRNIFMNSLKKMNVANSGRLEFNMKTPLNNNPSPSGKGKAKVKTEARKQKEIATPSSPGTSKAAAKREPRKRKMEIRDEVCASEDDDDDVVFERKVSREPRVSPIKKLKTIPVKNITPKKGVRTNISPAKSPEGKNTPTRLRLNRSINSSNETPSPAPKRMGATLGNSANKKSKVESINGTASTPQSTTSVLTTRSTPMKTHINFSPSISVQSSVPRRYGKTVINDNITPNPKTDKTYELNIDLDVSLDANVIVNVKRKKKATASSNTPQTTDSPGTRVRVNKESGSSSSPRTPVITLKKSKRLATPR